jgi:LysR family glycine cleavage system transcriptional activator
MPKPTPRRTLPPLNWLRAFESAARHLSFTGAAEELGVSQAAVSQQVRQLEDLLGTPLFKRLARGIALTDAGLAYLPALRDSFARIARETTQVFGQLGERPLTLRAPPTFAALWLAPRLREFPARHPEIRVRVTTAWAPAEFGADGIDIEIRYGAGGWPGVQSQRLFVEHYFPVASPQVAGRLARGVPAALTDQPLLHVLGEREGWGEFFGAHGIDAAPSQGPQFDSLVVALHAAAAGAGVVLATAPVADPLLQSGALIEFGFDRLPARGAHYVVRPAQDASPAAAAVADWLMRS